MPSTDCACFRSKAGAPPKLKSRFVRVGAVPSSKYSLRRTPFRRRFRRDGVSYGRRVGLLRNSRKTERGAKQFLTRLEVRAAPFALLMNQILTAVRDESADEDSATGAMWSLAAPQFFQVMAQRRVRTCSDDSDDSQESGSQRYWVVKRPMRKLWTFFSTLAAIAILATVMAAVSQTPLKAQNGGAAPKNLRVLTPENLMAQMQTFPAALGVEAQGGCNYCHDADRSLDTKPTKVKARQMIEMVADINSKFGDQKVHVTCWTCHLGSTKPEIARTPKL